MGKAFTFSQPVKVIFGSGEIGRIGREALAYGKKVLLVSTKELQDTGTVKRVVDILKADGVEARVYDGVSREPTSAAVDSTRLVVLEHKPEVIIGLGGGSAIDFAKALAIAATHPGPIWDYVNLSNRPPLDINPSVLPVISIPTTSGTGSEMTPFAVLINSGTKQKATIKSPYIYSRTAIIDPQLTVTLPPGITASTGVDAFTHALESYLNVTNRSPFSDLVAEEAIRIIPRYLLRAVKDGTDTEAREKMAYASMLGGIAIAQAGTTVIHALAQPLSARAGLPHGLTVALFTVPVLKYTYRADRERFARIAELLDEDSVSGMSEEQRAEESIGLLSKFLDSVGMLHKLSEYNVSKSIIDELTDDTTTYMARPLSQHPKKFSKEEIRRICEDAF